MIVVTVQSGDALQRLRNMAKVMKPEQRELANRQAGVQLHGDVIRTFAAQGQTQGRPRWLPLKFGGRWKGKGKGRRFQTVYQLLQDTGALRNAYIPLHDDSQAGVGAQSLKAHADLAVVHQFGLPAKNIPARPMLPTAEHALGVVTRIYGLSIQKAVAA